MKGGAGMCVIRLIGESRGCGGPAVRSSVATWRGGGWENVGPWRAGWKPALLLPVDFAGGEAGFGPGAEGADVGGFQALFREGSGDFAGTSAAAAVEDDFFAGVFFEEGFPRFLRAVEIAFCEEHGGLGDTRVGPLGGFAAIDEDGGAGGDAFGGLSGSVRGGLGGERERGGDEEGEEEVEFHKKMRRETRRAFFTVRNLGDV